MSTPARQKRGQASHARGMQAEEAALVYLQEQGYQLLARRYRNAYGEIDLIVARDKRLHFVEVKARPTLEDGLYALSKRQQQRLSQGALHFLAEHPTWQNAEMQFDLIVIAGWQLHHEMHIVSHDD